MMQCPQLRPGILSRMWFLSFSPDFLGPESPCLLDHSVRYFHMRSLKTENPNIDEPCSFADYYFMESLFRYAVMHGLSICPHA